ncbi:MAG: 1-phosphofructokinase family hexose kinase [Lachnospiraceae bacterium]|nr:1-phosphofructokinase family hexose kinase [Lachnospiraceae bacterium]
MIYTVTLSPSLDYIVTIREFRTGTLNRTSDEVVFPGGKGINVSVVLKYLGVPSTALGFAAGFTGEELLRILSERGIVSDFICLSEGSSRINVKIRSARRIREYAVSGETETLHREEFRETEINGQGPVISAQETEWLFEKLDNLKEDDYLVLAGMVPSSLPDDFYHRIFERLEGRGVRIVVDSEGESLSSVIRHKPFLIKPNRYEMKALFPEASLSRVDDVISCAKKLQEMGAQNILASMGGDGAVLLTSKGEIYRAYAPQGVIANAVGAGDAMVAGFLAGLTKKDGDPEYALRLAVAAGSATAFADDLATGEEIWQLFKRI